MLHYWKITLFKYQTNIQNNHFNSWTFNILKNIFFVYQVNIQVNNRMLYILKNYTLLYKISIKGNYRSHSTLYCPNIVHKCYSTSSWKNSLWWQKLHKFSKSLSFFWVFQRLRIFLRNCKWGRMGLVFFSVCTLLLFRPSCSVPLEKWCTTLLHYLSFPLTTRFLFLCIR